MTKVDLIEEVSRAVEMPRKDSEAIVDAIFDSIERSLGGGDKVEIRKPTIEPGRCRSAALLLPSRETGRVGFHALPIPGDDSSWEEVLDFKTELEAQIAASHRSMTRRRSCKPPRRQRLHGAEDISVGLMNHR